MLELELELELGVDPFSEGVSVMEVYTIGELYRVYREALVREVALETQ